MKQQAIFTLSDNSGNTWNGDSFQITTILQSMNNFEQWIPVTERLPEHNSSVLVYRIDKVGANSMFTVIWDDTDYFDAIGVTHWMNLPDSPK